MKINVKINEINVPGTFDFEGDRLTVGRVGSLREGNRRICLKDPCLAGRQAKQTNWVFAAISYKESFIEYF